ncbi:MAG: radical SAM protein [bacterium]|nr:radical SAM protein [bacterium]
MKNVFIVSSTYGGERLGLQILAQISKDAGMETFFYALDSMEEENLINVICDIKPDIISYSAMTYEHTQIHGLNDKLKKRISFISIFGGPHYTFNPEEIEKNEHMDVLCVGEGDTAFKTFLERIKTNSDFRQVSNLIVRQDKTLYKNKVAPLIEDLDELPFADRGLIPLDKKGNRFLGNYCSFMISRGCPYQCTYCFNSAYNEIYRASKKKVRWRSIPNVIAEMKKIKQEKGIDYILLADDAVNFLPKEYIMEFCQRYKAEIALPFTAQFRPNLIDEETVKALKEAGMICANCGVETGDEEVANKMLKRGITNSQIKNAFRILNKYKIKNYSQNVIGLPVENPVENAMKTIRLNIECKVNYAHFTLLVPFPKTPIEAYCRENGYLPESVQDLKPSVFIKTTLKYKKEKYIRGINNLHKFSSIAVRFPFFLPLILLLIKLPENIFFQYIYFLWHGFYRTVILNEGKLSFSLLLNGLKQISGYLKQYK